MKLYSIVTENIYGQPEVLMDEDGRPEVFVHELNATRRCDAYNYDTDGGYFVKPFETEDA